MKKTAIDLYTLTKSTHARIYLLAKTLHQDAIEGRCDMEELADLTYALREVFNYIDDMRKEISKTKQACERIACVLWSHKSDGDPIRTPYCTGTPKVKMMASLPNKRREPEKYAALMTHLGIDPSLWKGENDAVRVHWPGFVEHMTALAEKGLPLPAGIDVDKTYPVYSLTIKKGKKGITK